MAATASRPQSHETLPYSRRTSLNTVDVCLLDASPSTEKLWVVFIHGGAWRDPRSSSTDFHPAQSLLLASSSTTKIAGLASLNYRLSPHPDFPSDDNSRTALHPDHINDVLDAIAFLQAKYGFMSNYMLSGHSVGATLAFQAVMSSEQWNTATRAVTPPIAIVGLCGIYDIPNLVAHHAAHPVYEEFVTGALGERTQHGADVWAMASPTYGSYDDSSWPEGKIVLLAHSRDDELVEWDQVELMRTALIKRGWVEGANGNGARAFKILPLKGSHDEIWKDGCETARAIETCIERLSET